MNINIKKQGLIKFALTFITLILTVILPVIGYIQFKTVLSKEIDLGTFEIRYEIAFILSISIGMLLSGLRYFSYRYQRFSVKKGILNLISSIFFVIFLGNTAQIGNIRIDVEDSYFHLNLTGVFLLFITVWALFILKNLYNLIDYRVNHTYYERIIREGSKKSVKKN